MLDYDTMTCISQNEDLGSLTYKLYREAAYLTNKHNFFYHIT